MKFIKRNKSAIVSILIFVLGVVSKLFQKDKAPHRDLVLEVREEQIYTMLNEGGSVIFKDVSVNGRVRLKIAKNPE